jgi:hypothetical protein
LFDGELGAAALEVEATEIAERVGEDVSAGVLGLLKWTGFFATGGGGRLEFELVVEVERRRSLLDVRDGGGKTGLVEVGGVLRIDA